MTDRLVQLCLLACLTLLGLFSLTGVVILELYNHQTIGVLASVAGGVVVAMTGLMSRWGDSLKPLTTQMNQMQQDLSGNTTTTNKIATDVNGHNAALTQKITDLEAALVQAKIMNPPEEKIIPRPPTMYT